MTQLSAFNVFAATPSPAVLPPFTLKLACKAPPQGGRYTVQLNLLAYDFQKDVGAWYQLNWDFGVPTDTTPDYVSYSGSGGSAHIQDFFWGGSDAWIVRPDWGAFDTVIPIPGLSALDFQNGKAYVEWAWDGAGMTASFVDAATGKPLYSTTQPVNGPLPDIKSLEIISGESGGTVTFTQSDFAETLESAGPVQLRPAPPFAWGTYTRAGSTRPLYWFNETGEVSNLWTNIVSQGPEALSLEFSLTEGSQAISNPPPAPATCAYPVDVSSPPDCISRAFQDSGYWADLEAAVFAGTYPPAWLALAKSSPAYWLKSHPYLGSAYPEYFTTPAAAAGQGSGLRPKPL